MTTEKTHAFNRINAELNAAGTDRGIAVLGGSFIEGLLSDLLAQTMVPGKATDNFLRKTPVNVLQKIAFFSGLIPKALHEDLEKISSVRNAFAHRLAVESFDEETVREHIEKMNAGKSSLTFSGEPPAGWSTSINAVNDMPLRWQFIYIVAMAGGALDQIATHISQSARQPVESTWTYPV